MLFYEGRIIYEKNTFTVYFNMFNSRNYLFIIIGKTPEDTFKELTEIKNISEGEKLKVTGEIDYFKAIDDDALFCQNFEILE